MNSNRQKNGSMKKKIDDLFNHLKNGVGVKNVLEQNRSLKKTLQKMYSKLFDVLEQMSGFSEKMEIPILRSIKNFII